MFRYFKSFLVRMRGETSIVSNQQYDPRTEEFSFESLWDDYESRTWHYEGAKETLGKTNSRLLNWIGSVDQSGYIRERCLRELIANYSPGDENRILLRLADWVPQIQTLSRDWLFKRFKSLPFDAVSANQRLILYLSRKDCLRDDAGMREIEKDLLARTKAIAPSRFFGLMPLFRRYLFSLSLAEGHRLRPWILDDPDPFSRLLLLKKFGLSGITSDERMRLQGDGSVFVRRQLFRTQVEGGVLPGRSELIALALDSNRSLRELGQFYLKRNYGEDAYLIYRDLEDKRFFYIADYARREDSEHFLEGVRTGSVSTQYNCLKALAFAAPQRLKELGIAELISKNRRFRNVLLPLLPKLLTVGEVLALRSAFERISPGGVTCFLHMVERRSFWVFIDEGLSVLLKDHESVSRQMIVRAIRSKVTIYEFLSPRLRESILDKVSRLRSHNQRQNEGIADLLEFILKNQGDLKGS